MASRHISSALCCYSLVLCNWASSSYVDSCMFWVVYLCEDMGQMGCAAHNSHVHTDEEVYHMFSPSF